MKIKIQNMKLKIFGAALAISAFLLIGLPFYSFAVEPAHKGAEVTKRTFFATGGKALSFPLKQSLFWWDGGTSDRRNASSTWDWMARDISDAKRSRMYAKLNSYGINTITFIVFNMVDTSKGVVNPFLGCPKAAQIMAGNMAVDEPELARWKERLELGKSAGVNLIPCLFCGDDSATTRNTAFHEFFLKYAIPWLDPYSAGYLISTEASKSMNAVQMYNMIEYIKRYTSKPVGVHLAVDDIDLLPSNADWLAMENSYNPWDCDENSVADAIAELKAAIKYCSARGIAVFWLEEGVYCEGSLSRQKSRTAAGIAGCYGLPGPN